MDVRWDIRGENVEDYRWLFISTDWTLKLHTIRDRAESTFLKEFGFIRICWIQKHFLCRCWYVSFFLITFNCSWFYFKLSSIHVPFLLSLLWKIKFSSYSSVGVAVSELVTQINGLKKKACLWWTSSHPPHNTTIKTTGFHNKNWYQNSFLHCFTKWFFNDHLFYLLLAIYYYYIASMYLLINCCIELNQTTTNMEHMIMLEQI